MGAARVLSDASLVAAITEYQDGWPNSLLEHVRACEAMNIWYPDGTKYQVVGDVVKYGKWDICLDNPRGKPFIFHMAIVLGDDEKAVKIAQLYPEVITHKAVECAATHNRVNMIRALVQAGCEYTTASLTAAAIYGHLESVKCLIEECGVPCSARALRRATEFGHLEVLKYLHSMRPDVYLGDAIDYAAFTGHSNVVEYMCETSAREYGPEAFKFAVAIGRLDILQALEQAFPDAEDNYVTYAVQNNFEDIVDHLLKRRPEYFNDQMTKMACDQGHANIAEKLLSRFGAPADTLTTLTFLNGKAAEYLRIVEMLHASGYEVDPNCLGSTLDSAAAAGYLDIVRFLHENTDSTCSTEAMDSAAAGGFLDVIQFLHANRIEGCTTRAMNGAALGGHLDVVKFLHSNRTEGCTTDAMDHAARCGYLGIVQFLHTHRHEGCTKDAMDKAAENGYLQVVEYLHQVRQEGCTTDALDKAAINLHVAVVEFLVKNRTEGCTMLAFRSSSKQILSLLDAAVVDERPQATCTCSHGTIQDWDDSDEFSDEDD